MFAGPPCDDDAHARIAAASKGGTVLDLGTIDPVTKHDALAAADIVCLPSVADVFPLVFVEAWWCATPVVSGPFAGADEVVRHGVDGLVTAAEPDAVAAAVAGLLDDPRRRRAMGRAGSARAVRTLSWNHVARQLDAAYHTIANSRIRDVPARS